MAAEVIFCKFHQFGHCKFGSTCRKLHTMETCNTFKCIITDCSFRHPRQCKFFVLYGRCKFGTECSFLHVTSDDQVTKAIKTIQDEVLSLKSEILSLKSMNLDLQSSLEELKTVSPDEIESDIFPSFSCELCALEFTSDEILKEHISNVHDTIPDGQKQCLGVICATMSPSPRRVSRSIAIYLGHF